MACASPVDDDVSDSANAKIEQEIINGVALVSDPIGAPVLSTGLTNCSTTALRPRWLLTAAHCVKDTNGQLLAPSSLTTAMLNGTNVGRAIATFVHPTLDVALVRLDKDLLDAQGKTRSNRLYPGNVGSLISQTFFTLGWGLNVLTQCTPQRDGTGTGTLRAGNITMASASTDTYTAVASGTTIAAPGDSGSSPFAWVGNHLRAIGVHSGSTCTQVPLAVDVDTQSRADAFRDWANAIIGRAPTSGAPVGYERADGASAVVYVNVHTNRVKELSSNGGGWSLNDLNAATNFSHGAMPNGMSTYVRRDSASAVVFTGLDNRVRELALTPAGWRAADLSGSGVRVANFGRPSGYVRSEGVEAVVYRGTDGHIHELKRSSSGAWSRTNLSATARAPGAGGDPIGYVRSDTRNAVVYRSTAGRVIELVLEPAGWAFVDVSAVAGATSAGKLVKFGPRPYTRSDGQTTIVYVNASHEIEMVNLWAAGWRLSSFGGFTGSTTREAVPVVRADGVNAIYYVNFDQRVRELSLNSFGWFTKDVSGPIGAPDAPLDAVMSGYVRADNATAIVYQDWQRHVIELTLVNNAWSWRDLTNLVGGL